MKKFVFISLIFLSLSNAKAQYSKEAFLDSLKSCIYLKDYFSKNESYTDSSFINYMSTISKVDTFMVDTNAGFGYKPTKISFLYKEVDFLIFYTGLSISFFNDRSIADLAFYNYGSEKTGIEWKFHANGNIKEVITYPAGKLDTIKDFGKVLFTEKTYYIDNFSKAGKIESSGNLIKGKKSGTWLYFDKKGMLYKQEKFTNGKRKSRITFK